MRGQVSCAKAAADQLAIHKKKTLTGRAFFLCVAGPGGAPGLEDYAFCYSPITESVGLYLHPKLDLGVQRVVSTDKLSRFIKRAHFHQIISSFFRGLKT